MRVELTHDIIALKIWEQMPEQDKQVRLILNSFQQRFSDFEKKKGSLLGEKELNAWEEYFPLLNLSNKQKQFVNQSFIALKRAKRRRNLAILGLTILTILSIIFGVYALINGQRATESAQLAELEKAKSDTLNKDLLASISTLAQTEYQFNLDEAVLQDSAENFVEAFDLANEALEVIQKYSKELETRDIKPNVLTKFKEDLDQNGEGARMVISVLNQKLPNLPDYQNWMEKGESAFQSGEYVTAVEYFKNAKEFINTTSVNSKISMAKRVGYNYYLTKGIDHFKNETRVDFNHALINFREAKKLNNTKEVRQKITETQRKLDN